MKRLILFLLIIIISGCGHKPATSSFCDQLPEIFPDYTEITIPKNISPLNFRIKGNCTKVYAVFKGDKELTVKGKNKIIIPVGKWKSLINKKGEIKVTVKVKIDGKWIEYKPYSIYISDDEIDYGLCYRRIFPGYGAYNKMGLYQRELATFNESVLIENTILPGSCINCHSFAKGDPQKMQFHIRGKNGGTVIRVGESTKIVNLKNSVTKSCVYPYWHPSGKYIVYSVNEIKQIFHNIPDIILDVYDLESDIVIYDVEKKELILHPILMKDTQYETFPVFSADGKKIFFCSADSVKISTLKDFTEIKYSLCSINFDPKTGNVGDTITTLYNGEGASVAFPRPSYDGKYIMFTRSAYGNFTIWHKDSDLWILDLRSNKIRPLNELNSDDTESYHSWSASSNWVVFSSRRNNGLYTRPYLAHIDSNGVFSKPFILPQKDPDFYIGMLQSYNIPEFVTGKVDFSTKILEQPREVISLQQN